MRPPDLLVLLACVVAAPWQARATELSPSQRRTAYCAGVMKARMLFFEHALSLHPDMRAAAEPSIASYAASYQALVDGLRSAGILELAVVREAGLRAAADMKFCANQSSSCRDPSCAAITTNPRCAAILDCDETGAG
jgi:hypothetical protein